MPYRHGQRGRSSVDKPPGETPHRRYCSRSSTRGSFSEKHAHRQQGEKGEKGEKGMNRQDLMQQSCTCEQKTNGRNIVGRAAQMPATTHETATTRESSRLLPTRHPCRSMEAGGCDRKRSPRRRIASLLSSISAKPGKARQIPTTQHHPTPPWISKSAPAEISTTADQAPGIEISRASAVNLSN